VFYCAYLPYCFSSGLVVLSEKRLIFVAFAQFHLNVFVDIEHRRCYTRLIKGKEEKDMYNDSLYAVYANYFKYAEAQKKNNEEVVSFWNYALGRY
jgi:hypothetical protein